MPVGNLIPASSAACLPINFASLGVFAVIATLRLFRELLSDIPGE
jgi:hypothetical protein